MSWIPFYGAEEDFVWLFGWLNDDPELAQIVSDGNGGWIAKKRPAYNGPGRYCFWHTGNGPLVLKSGSETRVIDPWRGWNEERRGADPTVPYFGAGHPSIVWLNARPKSHIVEAGLGLSSFEWIGNHYRPIGVVAADDTKRFWAKTTRFFRKAFVKVPRRGDWDSKTNKPEIFALSVAIRLIKSGTPRDPNP